MGRAKQGFARISFNKTHWALALAAFGAAAQAAPAGPEFQVNTYTTDAQMRPAVAMDQDGDFVVAWDSAGQDGSFEGIFAQRYAANGLPQGGEFQVNSFTGDGQTQPAIAQDQDGDFVVVWISFEQDGDRRGVYGRRYNAAGVPQGSEFRVNNITTGEQEGVAVAMSQDGDFVVAWSDEDPESAEPEHHYRIFAQRYDASGVEQGAELIVKDSTTDFGHPVIAMDQAGGFVVAWSDLDGNGEGIWARRYDATGAPLGGEFGVNAVTTGIQITPAVAMDQAGDFVATWTSVAFGSTDSGIYARRFEAAGTPLSGDFLVNDPSTAIQGESAIAMEQDGNFVIVWQSYLQDGDEFGIYARRYDATGVPGTEFRVNTHTTGRQSLAAVAVDQYGDFVVTWEGGGSQDGDLYGIFAQRYAAAELLNARFAPPLLSGKSTSNTPVPEGPAGVYQFTAKFCLNAGADVADLFSRTKQLTNGNSLISRTRDAPAAPPGGAGSEQDFPLNLGYVDGVLSPTECVDVIYQIGLASKASFTFRVDLYGNVVLAP